MIDILKTITEQRTARNWTEYQLAEKSGLPQTTISSWYRKKLTPSVGSIEKICRAFGITFSQFFAEGKEPVELTEEQRLMLDKWNALSSDQKQALLNLIENMK